MAERSGVDLIIRGKDESGPAIASAERQLSTLSKTASDASEKMSKALAGNLFSRFGVLAAVQAVNNMFGAINEAQAAGKSGAELAEQMIDGFSKTLENAPLVGNIGTWLARNVFDPLTGDTMAEEAARRAAMAAGEAASTAVEQINGVIAGLRDQALSETEKRTKEFEERITPIIGAIQAAGGDWRLQQDRARTAFALNEERIAQIERMDKAIAEAAKIDQEWADTQARREAVAQRALAETARLRKENADAEMRLAGAVEAGSVSTVAMRFRSQRAATIASAQASPQQQVREQQQTNTILQRMLREQEEERRAIEALTLNPTVIQMAAL